MYLAHAREKWKAATWYAERRDQQRYGGHKVNINIGGGNAPSMSEALAKDASALIAQMGKEE